MQVTKNPDANALDGGHSHLLLNAILASDDLLSAEDGAHFGLVCRINKKTFMFLFLFLCWCEVEIPTTVLGAPA